MESTLHFFLPDDMFLTCDHGMDLDISLCEIFNPIQFNSIRLVGQIQEKKSYTRKFPGKKTPQHL